MSTRSQWLSRGALVTSAAVAGFITLWNAGFSLDWLISEKSREKATKVISVRSPRLSGPSRVAPVATVDLKVAFPGIDSSVSKMAQALILTGTIVGRNPREGSAFIGISEQNPQTYAAGAILANGTRLAEIAANYVILERDGKSVRLYVQGTKEHTGTSRTHDDILMIGGPQPFMSTVATNSDPITDFIRPTPMYEGDVLVGFQVYAGRRRSVFAKLGLQAGDVITSIDGAPLSDAQSAMDMIRQLTNGLALMATVSRSGKVKGVTLDGSIIVAELDQIERNGSVTAGVVESPAG